MLLFLQSTLTLNRLWRDGAPDPDRMPFQFRPKTHMLQHLVLDHIVMFGSPTMFWCYRDEDFCGAIKSIRAKTEAPSTMEINVLKKIRILASLSVRV
jgi:hypothetical protein